MKVSRSYLRDIIQDVLLESKQNGQISLYNTELYRKIKERIGKNISHRDYNAALHDMVCEFYKKQTNMVPKVFYSLTGNAVRGYQHNLLGIDKHKQRLRTLYQLLFFYEIGKHGERYFTNEEGFSSFLESVGLSLQNLKPSKIVEIPEEHLTHFEHVKGMVIVKHERIQENETACYYFVTLPGFTLQEILDYCNRTVMNSSRVVFYHSHYFLNMFTHLKFTERELKTAFQALRKASLIEPISFKSEDLSSISDNPPYQIRYAIVSLLHLVLLFYWLGVILAVQF
jgi:hypothetical protein